MAWTGNKCPHCKGTGMAFDAAGEERPCIKCAGTGDEYVAKSERLDTGVVMVNGDWPGVFLRGDDSAGFACSLRMVLGNQTGAKNVEKVYVSALNGLLSLLERSNVNAEGHRVDTVVHLEPTAATDRIAQLEAALDETLLALEYERGRIARPSVSGATALAQGRAALGD